MFPPLLGERVGVRADRDGVVRDEWRRCFAKPFCSQRDTPSARKNSHEHLNSPVPVQYDDLDGGAPPPTRPMVSPRRLLAALKSKWWVLLITTLLPIGPAYYYFRKLPVDYVSKATMWVRGKMRLADVGQYTEDVQTFYGTQIQLIQSERLQLRAIDRVKSTQPTLKEPKDEQGRLQLPSIRINQAPKSSVFVLESRSISGEYARAYLDALMDEFLLYKKEVRASTSGDALASVYNQVYKQEADLKVAHEKVTQFQKENNVALLEETLRGGGNQLAQMNAQIAMLQLDLRLMDAAEVEKKAGVGLNNGTNSVGATASSGPAPAASLVSPSLSSVPSLAQTELFAARKQLEMLEAQRDELASVLRPKHPKMVKLIEEVTRASRLVGILQEQSAEQVKAAREATKIRIKSLQDAAAEMALKVADANRRMAELEKIRADIARQQSFYERLLALLQGVDLNSSLNQEDFSILELAGESRKAKSQTLSMTGGAAFGGLMFGCGILFLIARRDDRCDSVVELRSWFPEPVFGQIPDMPSQRGASALLPIQPADNRHLFVEACRNLRSSLIYTAGPGERPKVILVTSAIPNEGKSTVAVNLATALAMGNARVLLIDADTRRGHAHDLLGVAAEPGLTDCLLDPASDPARFLQSTHVPNLTLLARGARSNQTGELFLGPSFDRLLKNTRSQFDFVIFDTIPVFAADDTTSLAPKADGVLFVVRREYTSSRLAQEALELLYQRQARVLGIVFNRVDSLARGYSYYKYVSSYAESAQA